MTQTAFIRGQPPSFKRFCFQVIYPKIKNGGLFSGHDYRVIGSVNRAVNEFASKVNVFEIKETQNDVWYWIK